MGYTLACARIARRCRHRLGCLFLLIDLRRGSVLLRDERSERLLSKVLGARAIARKETGRKVLDTRKRRRESCVAIHGHLHSATPQNHLIKYAARLHFLRPPVADPCPRSCHTRAKVTENPDNCWRGSIHAVIS